MPKRPQDAPTGNAALMEAVARIRAVHNLKNSQYSQYGNDGIADIITFCNSPELLNLPGNNLKLWTSQVVVLKALYMGSRGNTELTFTEEEWEWLYKREHIHDMKLVIQKLKDRESKKFRFSELTLVLGRRASKTVIASIIASYEAYKLLSVGAGDPYAFYNIPYDQELAVLNVANSTDQAHRLFSQIKARIRGSKFFQGRVDQPISARVIRLLTDYDLKRRAENKASVKVEGSIHLVCGHSNPNTLRGYTNICVCFDELGFYDEGTRHSGREFYEALTPPVAQFAPKGDGVIVEISTPGPKSGILYSIWKRSFDEESMLSFRLPTWEFNPDIDYDTNTEVVKARNRDKAKFDIEWGAEWPASGMSGYYFPEEIIQRVIDKSHETMFGPEESPGGYGGEYYMHVDPALTGNNYAAVIVRKQMYRDQQGVLCPRVFLSKVMLWTPEPSKSLNFPEIDDAILCACQTFRPTVVSYDQFNSVASLHFLRQHGINAVQTAFGRGYKNKIYQNLRELMIAPEVGLIVFEHPLLMEEMRSVKYTGLPRGSGMSIGADPRSDCATDDIIDCLCGAAFMACGNYYRQLPAVVTVHTGWR